MTVGGDFPANDDLGFEDAGPSYPVAFGIELTPQIQGALIGLFLVGISIFGFIRLVQPLRQTNTELRTSIDEKENQLATQQQQLENIEELRAELDRVVAQRKDIYGLLASQSDLETLLLDLNRRVEDTNAGIQDQKNRIRQLGFEPVVVEAQISSFNPSGLPVVIEADEPYGPALNEKVQVQNVSVQITGSFVQVESIIRNLERLEPLLIFRNFNVSSPSAAVDETVVDSSGRVILQPKAVVNASFQLEALLPTQDPDELPAVELPPDPGAEGEGEGEGGEAPPEEAQ